MIKSNYKPSKKFKRVEINTNVNKLKSYNDIKSQNCLRHTFTWGFT